MNPAAAPSSAGELVKTRALVERHRLRPTKNMDTRHADGAQISEETLDKPTADSPTAVLCADVDVKMGRILARDLTAQIRCEAVFGVPCQS